MIRAAAALALLASRGAAPARAQTVLRARDGATEHPLFVAAGVGVHLVAPAVTSARGHWLTAWSIREEIAAAPGACSPWPDDPHDLRCGAYRVSLDSRGRPPMVRVAR